MKSISLGLVGMVLTGVAWAADVPPPVLPANGDWIATFERYCAPPAPASNSAQSGSVPIMQFDDVLRALPPPREWPKLRTAVGAAVARVPIEQKLKQQQLEAAGWLLTYLTAGRSAAKVEIAVAAGTAAVNENDPRTGALNELLGSLDEPGANSGGSAEKQVKDFEQAVAMNEPLDEATVKQAVGGEENLAHLRHVAEVMRELRPRAGEIERDYAANQDAAAAQKKARALQQEYEEKTRADQAALAPYFENPVVDHYMADLLFEGPAQGSRPVSTIPVPDLVPAVGRDRATVLLRRAFQVNARLEFSGEPGAETRQLVREVGLAELANLKVASWGLLHEEHNAALFEALQRKFPPTKIHDYNYRIAASYYLTDLVQAVRIDDAVQFGLTLNVNVKPGEEVTLPYEVMRQLEQNHPDEMWKFLRAWLTAMPRADEWDRFNRLSAQLDRREELKTLIKQLAASGAFAGPDRLKVQQLQAKAELATGDFTAAIDRMRALVKTPVTTAGERSLQLFEAETLLRLADLQGDTAGFSDALASCEALIEQGRADERQRSFSESQELMGLLNELGRYADVLRIGHRVLALVDAPTAAGKPAPDGEEPETNRRLLSSEFPAQLLRAEVELGHWPEARALLSDNPYWEASDVAALIDRDTSTRGKPLGYYVAKTLQSGSDQVLTRRFLEQQLVATPGADSIYETYLAKVGAEAMPLLERLAAADHYEERPLIWKARLQLDAKQWDAAVATLQQAITIDPSDGEEGRGDRMRVYAFMSEALAAKGDAEKATFFANVVKAIRVSETADRWFEIGAYTRAIELYRDALGFFQDAYCIQSRLAIRLADEGKLDEAMEHYRRAFELMPDSFGRVESHCFGCEHVFQGKKSQGVADEVFARLLKARPDKPQLSYLLGYLREEQGRQAEAAELYRHAVQLDPLYLNAWNRLADLDEKLHFTPAQRDDLLLKLTELDPARQHVSPQLAKVTDLSRLSQQLKKNEEILRALPQRTPLMKLKASAERQARDKNSSDDSKWESRRHERRDLASVLMEHPFVQALQSYLGIVSVPGEAAPEEPAATPETPATAAAGSAK